MSGFAFAIPGDITLATGGYAYDRRVIAEANRSRPQVTHVALPESFPFPGADVLAETERLLNALPPGQPVLIDGLAYGALPVDLLRGLNRPIAALVHHPLALETGLDEAQCRQLKASEHSALGLAAKVIATSPSTGVTLEQDYGVGRDRLVVALPGTDPRPRARGRGLPIRLLAVGSVIPSKAYQVLIEALASLSTLGWTCHIVGGLDRDVAEVEALRGLIERHGLSRRVTLKGAMRTDELAREFDAADLFVSSSLYEGYGMGLTEALAHGLPIVAARGGAIPDTVPAAASILVPTNDATSLGEAIGALLRDEGRRRALAQGAWQHAQNLPRWPQTAQIILDAMGEIAR